MGFIKLVCPNCGAAIELSEDREYGFCSYCGTKVMQDKVVVEHRGKVSLSGIADVQSLLDRANLYIEDRRFDEAVKYCEKALDINPRNPEAYICKLMAQTRCKDTDEIKNSTKPLKFYDSYKKAVRFASPEKARELISYNDQTVLNFSSILNQKQQEVDEINKQMETLVAKVNKSSFWINHKKLLRLLFLFFDFTLIYIIAETDMPFLVVVLIPVLIASLFFLPIMRNKAEKTKRNAQAYCDFASSKIEEFNSWMEDMQSFEK